MLNTIVDIYIYIYIYIYQYIYIYISNINYIYLDTKNINFIDKFNIIITLIIRILIHSVFHNNITYSGYMEFCIIIINIF